MSDLVFRTEELTNRQIAELYVICTPNTGHPVLGVF